MQKSTLPSGEFDIKRIDVDEAIVEKKILGENVGKRQMTVEFIESEPKPISTKDMFGGKYEEMAMGVGEEKITMMGETGKFRMKEVSSSKIKDKLFPDDFWTDPKLVTDFDITPQTPRTIPLTEIQLSGKTIPPEYHTFGLTNKPKTTGLMARESFLFDAGVSLKDLSGVSGSGILGTGVKSDLPSFFSKVVIDPKTKIMIVPGVPGVFKRQTILQDLGDVYSGKYEEKPSIGITGKVTKVAGKKEELSPVSVKIKPSSKPLSKLSTSFTSEKTSGLQSTTKFPDTSLAFPTETEKNPLFQKPKKSDYIWTEDYEHIVTPPGYPSSSQMPAQSTVTLMSSKTNLTLKPLLKTTTPTIKTSLPSFKEVFKPEAVSKVESIFKTKKTVKKKEGIKQLTTQMPKQIEMSVTSFKSSLKPIEKTFQIRKQMPSLKQRQRLSFKTPLPPNIPSLKIPSIPFSHPSRISLTRPSRKRKVSRRKKSMLDMDIIPSADWLSLTMTEAKKRGKGHHPYPSPKIQKMFRKNIFASSMRFPTAEMLRGKGRLKL